MFKLKWKNLKGGEVRFFITIERCIKKRKTSQKSPKIGYLINRARGGYNRRVPVAISTNRPTYVPLGPLSPRHCNMKS